MTTTARANTRMPWLALALLTEVACGPNQQQETPQPQERPEPTQDGFELGPWTTVPAGNGDELALDGSQLYIADSFQLVLWTGDRKQFEIDSYGDSSGPLRIVGDRVYWGPGWVEDGRYVWVDSLIPEYPPWPPERPDGAYLRVITHAWAPDCARVVVVTNTNKGASVDLYANFGEEHVATLLRPTIAPKSAWVGAQRIFVGTAPVQMFDADGRPMTSIEVDRTESKRIDASADERVVIVVQFGQLFVLDGHDGTVLATWPGKWADAAIHPSGKVLAATVSSGHDERLHIACFDGVTVREIGRHPFEHGASAVALGEASIAIAGGGTAARAALTVTCHP